MKTSTTKPIPARVNSALLAKLRLPGEPVVIVKICDLGMTQDFELQTSGRTFLFRWDYKRHGHLLRVPCSVWHAHEEEVAHQVMAQPRLRAPMIVTFELADDQPSPSGLALSETDGNKQPIPAPTTTIPPLYSDLLPDSLAADRIPGIGADSTEDAPRACVAVFTEPAPADEATAAPFMQGDLPLHEAISLLVSSGAMRLKAVARQFSVSEQIVRDALQHPEATAEVARSGWVRPKP